MRIPIAYALSYPQRLELGLQRLNLAQCGGLAFEPPDHQRFPALRMAYEALAAGGVKPAVLNAANEAAVEAFLAGRIGFTQIAEVVGAALDSTAQGDELDLQAILAADQEARVVVEREIQSA
jgi:1-deoxy-D-xylulose-5-phosphate reductoisomerase